MLKIDGIEYPVRVKFIGETRRLSMINGKIYSARRSSQKGWFGVIDETGEEYAYPPTCFEIVEDAGEKPITNIVRERFPNIKPSQEALQAIEVLDSYYAQYTAQ